MFREPTKSDLQAAAGWTLVKRSSVHDAHAVALDRYREGCESLIPHAETGAAEELPRHVEIPRFSSPYSPPPASPPRIEHEQSVCVGRSGHKFNIATQKCLHCGKTRMEALAREPELMVP